MDEAYIGSLVLFAGNFAPRGWAFCNGQILPIAQNTALFSILGTTYGGNGQTTFALPDLRGRVPVHSGMSQGPGLSPYQIGQAGGVENVTLTTAQMPVHTHSLGINTAPATTNMPTTGILAQANYTDPSTGEAVPVNEYAAAANAQANSISAAGGSQPVTNVQPYLGLNYIICLQGLYPTRE